MDDPKWWADRGTTNITLGGTIVHRSGLQLSKRAVVTALLMAAAFPAKAGVLSLSGSFLGSFTSAPMPELSGTWTATVDTATATVIGTGSAGTLSTAAVAPTTFTMSPNPLVMDPSAFSPFATFDTSNVAAKVFLLNGVPIGGILGGTRDDPDPSVGGGFADFWVTYDNQVGGFGTPPATHSNSITYYVLVGGSPMDFISSTSAGSLIFTESQTVTLAPAGMVEFLGGLSGGGVGLSFANGYAGQIVVNPFYADPPAAPNFLLAYGGEQLWNIDAPAFTGSAEVSFSYDEDLLQIPEIEIAVYHFSDLTNNWELLPSVVDTDLNIVTATTTSFSPFALGARSQVVPEPHSAFLVCLGLLGLGALRLRSTGG